MVGQAFGAFRPIVQQPVGCTRQPKPQSADADHRGLIKTPGNGGNAGFIASKSGLDAGSGLNSCSGYPAEGNHLRFDLNGGSGGADLTGNINITRQRLSSRRGDLHDGATMKLYVDGVLDVAKVRNDRCFRTLPADLFCN